jgi:sugar/nucleoside kinase (ribokinase family)
MNAVLVSRRITAARLPVKSGAIVPQALPGGRRLNRDLHFDYTTIGHVTIDVLDDGSRRAGGTAFYSAVQAARLGLRARILTRGVPGEIEALLEPFLGELELTVLPAPHTTTLRTLGAGSERSQRVLAWAGPIAADLELDTKILHLAPVARETLGRWRVRVPPPFIGLTPQGLVRDWSEPGGEIVPVALEGASGDGAAAVAVQCDAIVVNEHERANCASMIAAARAGGTTVAVTAGAGPITILAPGGEDLVLDVPELERPVDDLGAGDVFAAAFFVAISEGRSPQDAAGFASAAAAVRINGPSAGAIGGREEIEARARANRLG